MNNIVSNTLEHLNLQLVLVLEADFFIGYGLKTRVLKQKSRLTAAKIKIRRFWDTYNAPSKACDKKLSVFSSNGGPPDSVARPAIKTPTFISIFNSFSVSYFTNCCASTFNKAKS